MLHNNIYTFYPGKIDFEHVRRTLQFSAGPGSPTLVRRECFTIRVIDDDIHEEVESFAIRLTAQESGVSFVPDDTAEVFILDNDGRLSASQAA